MFLLYKILTILTIVIIVSYTLSATVVLLFVIALVLFYWDTDLQVFFYLKKFTNVRLKVRNSKQTISSYYDSKHCSIFAHSTPNMQNSQLNTSKCTFSPISNGANGISKKLGYSVSSTPYVQNSLFSPPRITPLRHPPRYFLSNASPTRSPTSTSRPVRQIQKISGPLLASTRFNVNLGTYTDTKSPGLSSRIVQYDNETKEKHILTHQAKYGSPGVFPVVHFFKKNIPCISPKLKKVTVRIASPDANVYSNSKYTRRLPNETITEINNGHDGEGRQVDISTRSVLDALKEISRKRIHTSTEFETDEESTKRKRIDCINNVYENNKRTREDSPVQESNTTVSQPLSKKICVVDVLAASFTSSNLLKEQLEKGLKRKAELEESEEKEEKQMKLINAETQTLSIDVVENKPELIPSQDTVVAKLSNTELMNLDDDYEEAEVLNSPTRFVKIFDEKRLEINRKNKLATLLSAITGDTPKIIPYNSPYKEDEKKHTENKLVSIISPQNKPKHDRHVSFNLPPDDVSDKNRTEILETAETNVAEVATSVATPTLNFGLNTTNSVPENEKLVVETSPNSLPNTEISFPKSVAHMTFDNTQVTNTLPSTAISSPSIGGFSLKPQDKVDTITQNLNFAPASTAAVSLTNTSPKLPERGFSFGVKQNTNSLAEVISTQSPSIGGFKFDFNKSSPNKEKQLPIVNNNLTVAPSLNVPTSPNFAFRVSQNTSPAKPIFLATTSQNIAPPSFGLSQPALNRTADIMNFGSNTVSNKPLFTAPSATNAVATSSMFEVGNTTTASFGIGSVSGSSFKVTSPFNTASSNGVFNTTNTTPVLTAAVASTPFWDNFKKSSLPSRNSTSLTFGSTSPAGFSVTTTAPPFASNNTGSGSAGGFVNNTTAPSFGSNVFGTTTASNALSAFPSGTTSVSPFSNSNPGFGPPATSAISFGTNVSKISHSFTTTPSFGTNLVTSTATFGTNSVTSGPTFGTNSITSGPTFGTNSVTSGPMFGTNLVTSTPTFGTNNVTNGTPFGSLMPKTQSLVTSSTPNVSPFGSGISNTQGFGTNITSTPSFSSNTATLVPFSTPTTTAVPAFGNTTAPKTFSFGPSAGTSAGFGNNTSATFKFPVPTSPPIFNAPKTTTSFNTNFGSTSNQVMGFGSSQQQVSTPVAASSSPFGASSPFLNAPPGFGVKSDSAAFASQATPFGNKNGTFGPAVTNNNTSFNSTNLFGSTAGSNQNFGSGFGAGDNSAFAKPQVANIAFGNANLGDSSFQFGNGPPAGPASANSAQSTFGSNSNIASAVPASSIFAFGSHNPSPVPAPSSGVFAFGSSDAPKPRFNFSNGSNVPPAFGAASPNTNFNPNVPQFAPPAAGMFSIGSGSSTNRSRTQLKVKRRN